MPLPAHKGYPTRDDVIDYLTRYEARYQLPVRRPVRVSSVVRTDEHLEVISESWPIVATNVVSATGTWTHPYIPNLPGRELFQGTQVHSAH